MERSFKFTLLVLGLAPFFVLYLIVEGMLSPMKIAIENNWPLAVSALSKMGYTDKLYAGRRNGCARPVHMAARLGNQRLVDILLDDGASPGVCTEETSRRLGSMILSWPTVLSEAAAYPALITHLVKQRHIDPDLKDKAGDTALSHMLDCNDGLPWRVDSPWFDRRDEREKSNQSRLQSLKILLDFGANPDAGKEPPLYHAAVNGCVQAVTELLAHKADAALAEARLARHFADENMLNSSRPPLPLKLNGIEESLRLIKRAAGK